MMEFEQVRGNTWVLKSWELIPVYRLDEHQCILLDTGLARQREELKTALDTFQLEPVGIICSHAHIDHMGNNAFLMETYGTKLAMALGEAGHQFSYLGLNVANFVLSPNDVVASPDLNGTPCLADRVILPNEEQITFCGVPFDIIHTPGHTADHICVRTPDDVLYLGDAMMTGRTLHHSKFPYAFSMQGYLDSMRKIRTIPAAKYVVAHYGVYDEVLPLIDMEVRFLAERMLDLLDLVDGYTTPKKMASAICRAYHIDAKRLQDLAYFEAVSQTYINYLRDLGYLDACMEDNQILYRKTQAAAELVRKKTESVLPKPGLLSTSVG
ncbi:MAG: MBL fold metallo-hydrolase [Evtepia sp.]|uniref:MBL fold metallo-hydrolase n=1 Tax=Evtepia sp. TaxID=2773933 RepID=UPI002A74CD5F|nr:MBL fold metallo-hydrolase [Evtepia sp.]MDY3014911.1 MBL fold metallo-hydrolase [Evtepia sp.]